MDFTLFKRLRDAEQRITDLYHKLRKLGSGTSGGGDLQSTLDAGNTAVYDSGDIYTILPTSTDRQFRAFISDPITGSYGDLFTNPTEFHSEVRINESAPDEYIQNFIQSNVGGIFLTNQRRSSIDDTLLAEIKVRLTPDGLQYCTVPDGNFYATLDTNNLTTNRGFAEPDMSGTRALVENTIPLTGTSPGNPVTGEIQVSDYTDLGTLYATDGDFTGSLFLATQEATIGVKDSLGADSIITVIPGQVDVYCEDPTSRGLTGGGQDYTANIQSLDYVQKKYVDDVLKPYKVYTALLTQTGTGDPIPNVLENTLGAVTFAYSGVGEYSIDTTGLFTIGKTMITIGLTISKFIYTEIGNNTGNTIYLFTRDYLGASENDVLVSTPIEIRVYN